MDGPTDAERCRGPAGLPRRLRLGALVLAAIVAGPGVPAAQDDPPPRGPGETQTLDGANPAPSAPSAWLRWAASPELVGLADDVIEQGHRAATLLHRLRGTVRGDEFEWRHVDLNALAVDTTRLVDQAAQRGVRIRVKMTPEAPLVNGDRVQLQQVIVNIVTNAVHAAANTPTGAATAAAASAPGLVRVETRRDADGVLLTVTDTGPGITPDALPRLFEPFYTTRKDGLGLGLSISRSIVSVHSGELTARNLARGGAEFTVMLPVAELDAPELAGKASESA